MSRCSNTGCLAPLNASNRSGDSRGLCSSCGRLVWAFRPDRDKPLDWFELVDLVDGAVVDGDQCDGCGLSSYTLEHHGGRRWVARCAGQRWDGEDLPGCGTGHPVRQKASCEVIPSTAAG
jgi:hypothetical protein